MNCLQCGKPLPDTKRGPHAKQYCNDACRQAHHRQKRQGEDMARQRELQTAQKQLEELAKKNEQIATLQRDLQTAQEEITELTTQVTRLEGKLDLERRFYQDNQLHSLKAWLKKQLPSPLGKKIQGDLNIPPRAGYSEYRARLRSLEYSPEEMIEFDRLWRLMLLS